MASKRAKAAKAAAKATKSGPQPRAKQPAPSSNRESPLFCLRHTHSGGTNAWGFAPSPADGVEILGFLAAMSRLSWSEIAAQTTGGKMSRHRKHHDQPIDTLVRKAQSDLRDANLDETFGDTIFRFRLAGVKRLWGYRQGRTFHVVWWDPEHQVYPTDSN